MKKITLIFMLLTFGFISAQDVSLESLLERLQTTKNSTVAISDHFSPTELAILKQHFTNTQQNRSPRGGGVLAYGVEASANGYGSFDIAMPDTFTSLSGGSGTLDFESAGAINPANENQAFAMDNAGVFYEVDVFTGVYTELSTTFPLDATGMEYNPVDNVLYMVTATELYTLDPDALTSTLVGALNTGGALAIALAIDGEGNAYTYDILDDTLYGIDLTTGNATVIGSIGFDASFGQGMAWDPSQDRILMAAFNVDAFDSELRSVNVATGATSLIGAIIPGETTQISWLSVPDTINDEPLLARPLTVGETFESDPLVGDNTEATASEIEDPSILDPTCSTYGGGDLWYSVTVPSTGQVTIETNSVEGSAVTDTGMSVYEGEIGALVEVECNDDDSEDGLFSLIALSDRTAGETLYIRIFEAGNDDLGEFQVAAYSDCFVDGGSIELTDSGSTETTICSEDSDPIEVTAGGDAVGTNMGWVITDNESGEILGLPMAPPFDLSDAGVGVCNIWYISYEDGLTGLEVGGNAADLAGCFDLSNPIVVTRSEDVCPPDNSECEDAIEVFCDDVVAGTTINAADSGSNPSGDVFYTYVTPADEAQEVTLSLCGGGTTYDSFLRVFDDGCNLVNEIAQNDDSCGLQSEVSFVAELAMTYTIMVEGFATSTGDFSLAVTCEPFLSVNSTQFENFTFYPNPAQERINLDAQQAIEHVTIFNMLGQEVLNQKIDVTSTQLDVSTLSPGNYIMQVIIDGQKGVYQVLKN